MYAYVNRDEQETTKNAYNGGPHCTPSAHLRSTRHTLVCTYMLLLAWLEEELIACN